MAEIFHDRDIVAASDELKAKEVDILEKGLQPKAVAENTVMPEELERMIEKYNKGKDKRKKLI